MSTTQDASSTPSEPPVDSSSSADVSSPEKQVRFASLDLVHSMARRVSQSFRGRGANGGVAERENLGESDNFFVDQNLASELNAKPNGEFSASTVGHEDSVILWRNLIPRRFSPSANKNRRRRGGGAVRASSTRYENGPTSRLPMRYRKEVATLLVLTAVATEFIGISISLPVLIPYAGAFGVPEKLTGLVFSVVGFSTFLSNLWIPIRSDTMGRKPILIATLLGSFVAYSLEVSAPSFEILLLGLFLGGFFGGTQPVAVAYISDIYSPAERPRFIGMVPACASICFTMGPAIGGYLSSATGSYRSPLVFGALVVACFLPIMIYFLPDSRDILSKSERECIRKSEAEQPERKALAFDRRTTYGSTSIVINSEASPLVSGRGYHGPLRDPRCWLALAVELFRCLAFSGFITTIPLVLQEPEFGLDGPQEAVFYVGIVIGISSAVKSIGLFVLFDRIQKRIGLPETILLGSFVALGSFLLLMFTSSIPLVTLGFSLFCFGSSMVQPGNFAYVTLLVPHEYVARAVAMPNVATALGQTVAPIAGSALLFATSYRTLYMSCVILMAAQTLIALSFLTKKREVEREETVHREEDEEEEEAEEDSMEPVVPVDEFEELLMTNLRKVLGDRNYDLRHPKAQRCVLEIISRSFPYLRDYSDGDGNERDIRQLYAELQIQGMKHTTTKRVQRENSLVRSSVGFASPSTSW